MIYLLPYAKESLLSCFKIKDIALAQTDWEKTKDGIMRERENITAQEDCNLIEKERQDRSKGKF